MVIGVGSPLTLSLIRIRMVAMLRSFDGVSADDPRYLDLIAPTRLASPARRIEMGKMSGCALSELGFWRELGLDHDLLETPYVDGKAPEWLLKIARDRKALRTSGFSLSDFQAGNGVVVDGDKPTFHTYTIVDPQPAGPDHAAVLSVDGGQRVGTNKAEGDLMIKRVVIIDPKSGRAWDQRETPPVITRRITHTIDLDALFAAP